MSQIAIITNVLHYVLPALLIMTSGVSTTMSFVNNNGGITTTESLDILNNATNPEYQQIVSTDPFYEYGTELTLIKTIATTIQDYTGKNGFQQAISILNSVFAVLAFVYSHLMKYQQQQLKNKNKELTINNEILTEQFATMSAQSLPQLDTTLTVNTPINSEHNTEGTHYPSPIILTGRNEPIDSYE